MCVCNRVDCEKGELGALQLNSFRDCTEFTAYYNSENAFVIVSVESVLMKKCSFVVKVSVFRCKNPQHVECTAFIHTADVVTQFWTLCVYLNSVALVTLSGCVVALVSLCMCKYI